MRDDPEFQALIDEFLKSLSSRAEMMELALSRLPDPSACMDCRMIAHRVAGIAPTLGFQKIAVLAERIEEIAGGINPDWNQLKKTGTEWTHLLRLTASR